MRGKLAILLAALVAMCLVPLHSVQAQKNKKNKTQASQVEAASETTPPLASGQVSFYVTIRGVKQGIFKGQSTNSKHANEMQGLQFMAQVTSPRDAATGMASGKRQYSPIVFTKQWDAASPQLLEALTSNESLSLVEFDFIRTSATGEESVYETIKLTNATISSLKRYIGFPDAGEPPDARALEDVGITFQKIEISNNDGKTTAMDDWTAGP